MKTTTSICRLTVMVGILANAGTSVAFAQIPDSGEASEQHDGDVLPSYKEMLATALVHNPDVRSAKANLASVRLKVAKELRAYRQQWDAECEALAALKRARQNVERLRELRGAIAGSKLQEAELSLYTAEQRAIKAKRNLSDMRLLLVHLSGHNQIRRSKETPPTGNAEQDANRPQTSGDQIDKLLRQRLEILERVADLQSRAYRAQEVGFDAVASAQIEVLNARLELAKSPDELIIIRRQMLQNARQVELIATNLVKANEATEADLLKAKALRLRAEVNLQRELAKAAP